MTWPFPPFPLPPYHGPRAPSGPQYPSDAEEAPLLEAINHGHRKISHWLIINRIRWEVAMKTTGQDFKICNNHIAFYARLFVKVHPQYRFIFNLKRMADEPWHGDMPL